jgi:GAF domain-containing protein
VYRSGEPLRLPLLAQHIADGHDSVASAAYGRTLALLGDGPGLIVPIIAAGAVVAVLTMVRIELGAFADADVALLVEVAEAVSALLAEAKDKEAKRESAAASKKLRCRKRYRTPTSYRSRPVTAQLAREAR